MGQAPSIFTVQFSSVAPSCRFFATPWVAAHQASLSITNSWNLLKLMSIKSVMPSNHLILCCPLLLLPSILPSIKVFSNESVLCIRWPKFQLQHQSFHEYSGLISFRIDWFDLLAVQGTLKSLLRHHNSKASGWQRTALTYSFPNLEPVCCSMSGSNYCFLTCIQISQETCRVVWYSRLFKNFPQLIVIHTVKGFGLVNKAEIDVFWNSLAFSMIQRILAICSLVPLPFLNPAWTSGSSRFTYCWSLAWRILNITLLACEMSAIVW